MTTYQRIARLALGTTASCVLTCVMPATARADATTTATSLEEVVVTARKREEKLIDVPMTISTISEHTIAEENISTLRDLADYVPGITIVEGARGNEAQVSIRGLNTSQGRSPVAILVDDVDITAEAIYASGSGYLINLGLLDVERVDVAKGPQAALYGRSAFGGAINYVTRRPDLNETKASVELDAGDRNQYSGRGSFSIPLVPGAWAIGISGTGTSDQGFYRNAISGQFLGGDQNGGAAIALNGKPTDALSIYGHLEYSRDHQQDPPEINTPANTTVNLSPTVAAAVGGTTSSSYWCCRIGKPTGSLGLSIDPATGEDYSGIQPRTGAGILNIDYDFGGVALKSLSGYFDQAVTVAQDGSFGPQPYGGPTSGIDPNGWSPEEWFVKATQRILSEEVRLYSKGSGPWQWMVGGNYWTEHAYQEQTQHLFLVLGDTPISTITNAEVSTRFPYERFYSRDTDSSSVFFWTQYKLSDQWTASLEARGIHDWIRYGDEGTVQVYLVIPPTTVVDVAGPANNLPVGIVSSGWVTPKATLSFEPTPDHNVYATVAEGVKPAGYNTIGTTLFNQYAKYGPEHLWSYEIGDKSRLLDGQLFLNPAFYYQDYRGQQVSFLALDDSSGVSLPNGFTANAAGSTRWGIDFAAAWKFNSSVEATVDYSYVHARYTNYVIDSDYAPTVATAGCAAVITVGGVPECSVSYNGKTPGQVPTHQLHLALDGNYPINSGYTAIGRLEARYMSDRYTDDSDTAIVDGYWSVDARVGLRWSTSELNLYCTNCLNEQTVSDAYTGINYQSPSFGASLLEFLPKPRIVGLRYLWHL